MDYEVVAVARTPQAAGAPTLVELGPLPWSTLAWTRELDRPDTIDLTVAADRIADDIKARLRDLAAGPLEARVYRGSDTVAAGPIIGGRLTGPGELSLVARGLLYYLRYMWVTADLTYTGVDQHLIAKALVDHWQALSYGNYGIVTSGVAASGTTRDRTYVRDELVNIAGAVEQLGEVDGGYDVDVDPATRALLLASPRQGVDRSTSVFLDARNIADAGAGFSVAADDLASDVFTTGTDGGQATRWSTAGDATRRAAWGRAGAAATFDGVKVQATLDAHAAAFLASRSSSWLLPAPGLIPVPDAEVGDFDVGDTVSYSFDAGLGLQSGSYRITRLRVSVDEAGQESLAVEVA